MSPTFGFVIMLALAVFFYKAAEFENLSMPIVWGGGSLALYLVVWQWGFWGIVGVQLALFAWMAVWVHLQKADVAPLARKHAGRCASCGRALPTDAQATQCPICGAEIVAGGSD